MITGQRVDMMITAKVVVAVTKTTMKFVTKMKRTVNVNNLPSNLKLINFSKRLSRTINVDVADGVRVDCVRQRVDLRNT